MHRLFRKDKTSPSRQEPPSSRASESAVSPARSSVSESDAAKKLAIRDLDAEPSAASAVTALLALVESHDHFPLTRSEAADVVKRCSARVASALRNTIDAAEKPKAKPSIFTSASPPRALWCLPPVSVSLMLQTMQLLSLVIRDESNAQLVLDEKLGRRLVTCLDIALHESGSADAAARGRAIESMAQLLRVLVAYAPIVADLAEKDQLLPLYQWCSTTVANANVLYTVLLQLPKAIAGPHAKTIVAHLRSRDVLLILLEQMAVLDACDASGILRVVAAHLQYAAKQNLLLLHAQLQSRRRYEALLAFLVTWLTAEASALSMERTFDLIHSLQELLASGNETPGSQYTSKVKETLTILKPTPRPRLVCTCNSAVLDILAKLIYRLQQPLAASTSTTSYQELVQCQLVHTIGHVLAQDASHYIVASEAGLLEGFLQRLEDFSDVVKLAIGSVISSVAMETGVVPMLELRRMQLLLDMRTFSYTSVHMLLVLLANLVRFHTEYLDVLRTLRLTETLYHMFVEDAQATFRYAWPTGDGLATECDAAALDGILVSHTELLATEEDECDELSDVGASIVANDHNVPLMFELLSASMAQNACFWTRDLLDAMSTWVFEPAHRHPCVFLWATLVRSTVQTQPTAVFTTDAVNWGLQAIRKTLVSPTPDWHLVVLLLTYLATLQSPSGLRPWNVVHVTEHLIAPLPTPDAVTALASMLLACEADVVFAAVLLVLSRSPPTEPPLAVHVVDALFCLVQTCSLQSNVFQDDVQRRIPMSFHGRLLVAIVASTPFADQAALATHFCWYVAALAVDVVPATLQSLTSHHELCLVHPEAIVGLLQLLQVWSAHLKDDVIDPLVGYLNAVTASSDHITRLVDAGALEAMLRAHFPMTRDVFRPLGELLVHMAQVRLGPRDLRTWVECILSDACPSLLPRLLASYPCDDDLLSTTTNLPRLQLHLDRDGYAQYAVDVPQGVVWPPQEGYTISSWIYIAEACEAHSDVEKLYHQLTQRDTCIMCRAVYASPVPLKCSHVACRACVQRLTDFGGACVVCNAPSLYLWSLRSADGRSVVDVFLKGTKLFMKTNATKHPTPFQHPPLLEKRWYHIALVHAHQRFQFQSGSAVSLYIQGSVQETTKLSFPAASPSAFSAFFGVPSATRRSSKGKWCLGPTYVIEEPLAPGTIAALYATGPQYDQLFFGADGNGTLPVALDGGAVSSASTFLDVVASTVGQSLLHRPVAPAALPTHSVLIGADKILFAYSARNAIGASRLCNTSRHGLPHAQGSGGAMAVDPTLLPQASFQLCGAGAKLAYVLLEHARTVEGVDASLQLLLALTRGHHVHLAGVERESGYEIVNFLLRQKSHLLSQKAHSTLFSMVQGDLFNCAALQHWILDLSIWLPTSANVQRALCATLYQLLLVATSVDKKKLQSINIVRQLLDVFVLGNLCLELAAVFADLVLVCLDTLATDANYVDVSLFLASLMSSNFRFVTHDASVASVPKQLDRWGLSPRGRSRDVIATAPDRALHRQAHLRELLLSMVIKAVQKQDVKLAKLQAADASPTSSGNQAPTMLPRPKIHGARKLLTPAWLGLFLYPSQLPQLPLVAASPNTVLLGLQLLGVLLTNKSYEVSFKHKGLYKVLASALPASDHAGFPFEAMYFSLFCLVLGPPVDGWPHKVDRIILNVAHLTHDFAPNIASNLVKNHNMVAVLLAVVRRAYAGLASIETEPDILHLEVLRFLRYLYETMPAFADVVDTSLHRDLATLIAAVVLSQPETSFAHPVAVAALDLLVESLTLLCVTTLTGLNVARSIVAGSNTGSLSDATFAEFQSLLLVMMLKRVKDKLSTQEFWLPGSVCIIDNIGGLCLLALSRIQCWQTAQPGIPASCGPTFCANGPVAVMDLVLYLVCETPVGTNASKASFQPPSQDKKKRQLRQFLGTIGVNLSRTAFETDPFMEAMFASLNGVVLHVLAVQTAESVLSILQRLHRQREVILGSRNGDKAFFRCLCRHLLQWLLLPDIPTDLRDASIALWIDLLYFQKTLLSEMLTVTLKVPNNAGYAVNLVKNGFDMLLTSPKEEFLKWLELVGPPIKQLEANLDASYVLWVERTRKDVSKEWATYFAEKRKPVDDKAFLHTKCKEQALELHDPCRREIQRQARSQADSKDRDLFGKRQFAKAATVVSGGHNDAHRHTNLFVHEPRARKAPVPTQWYLDRTEGTYRMRKRLLALPTPPPSRRIVRHRRAYSCSDLGRVLAVGLDVPQRPASPKQSRLQSSASLVFDGDDVAEDDDDDLGWHKWVQRDDSALDAKLRPLLLPGDDVNEDLQDCQRVDGMDKCPSVLLLGTHHVYLVDHLRTDDHSKRKVVATGGSHECRFWSYDDILELHKRRYLLQHVAIELFANDGRNYLIAFGSGTQRERVFGLICAKCPNVKGAASGLDRNATSSELLTKLLGNSLLERWVHGDVTNFEYLMHLNTLAGRSYNDLTQYPVFPWILSDYTSATIDLSDPSVYRDLSKPMGALYREEEFRTRYESLEDGDVPAFHYGTHYSSSGIVLHYLMRLEPFTRGIQQLQGGRFDHADRLFASIPSAYASASGCSPSKHQSSNTQDVKELIPEFFYLPSFLENRNNIDFGRNQNGVTLRAVTLPPWAHGSAAEFVRVNRAALESPFVSSMLHHWIDLIFGYKQQGPHAVEACNVFYHLTYEGALDLETIADPALRAAYLDQINEFGQTPSQLFKMPHPPREKDKSLFRTRMQRTFLNRSVLGNSTPEQQPSPSDAPTLPTSLSWPNLTDVKATLQPELKREGSYNAVVESFRDRDATVDVSYSVGLRGTRVVVVPSHCLLLPPPADALLSSDVKFLAWRCRDRALRLFSMGDGGDTRLLTALELPDFCASGAVATADSRTIVTIDARAPILHVWFFKAKVHLTRTGAAMQLQATLAAPQHGLRITATAVSRAYSILISGCSSGHVLLWDLNRLVVVRKVLSASTPIVAAAIHDVVGDVVMATANAWYVGDVNGDIYASAETSVAISALCVSSHDAAAWSVETLLVTGHVDGTVRLWSYGLGPSVLKSICGGSGPRVTSVVLSKDAKRVYAGHADGRVYLWRLESDVQG